MKKGVLLVGLFLFSIFLLGVVYVSAQENLSEIDENAELSETEGITPDSAFYFFDEFFDRFSDEVKVRQEKVAEIKAMIEKGNYEAAREALENYKKYAENLEREVSPEQRDEARKSAAAIYNVLKSLENQIPEEDREEFVDDILEREERIVTAAEIASKIKELCEQLSELNPLEYSRACKTGDDSPKWQKDLHERLTDEQREEAEDFFNIMIQCFETSGESCRCQDISIVPFAEKCSLIAPLAFACDVQNDEAACDEMDAIEEDEPIEDLLPDYLKDVLRSIENRFDEERFEHYGGPRECEGIRDKAECEELIFRNNAPQECVEELLDRNGISFDRDYGIGEAQRDCEAIMFELEAPQECIDAGFTDFRECGVLMFSLNAPKECLDAGLTGEYRSDERKCREIVGDFGEHDRSGPNRGPGSEEPFINFDCRSIDNPDERLACYDGVLEDTHDYENRFEETYEQERICAETCSAQGGAWDFSSGQCECHFREEFESSKEGSSDESPPYDCALLDCFEGSYCDPYAGCVEEQQRETEVCIDVFDPVCGVNEVTYSNSCFAGLENVGIACSGGCPCETTATEVTTDTTAETTETTSTDTTTDSSTDSDGDGVTGTGNAFLEFYFR